MKAPLYLMAILIGPAHAQSICLAPGSFDTLGKGGATPEQYQQQQTTPAESIRYVRLDQRQPVAVTSTKQAKITAIKGDDPTTHTLTISRHPDMSQPVARFPFSFRAQRSNELCLWYNTFYGTWRLQPVKGSPCRCP